jgi:hypothetical protein
LKSRPVSRTAYTDVRDLVAGEPVGELYVTFIWKDLFIKELKRKP